MKEERLQGFKKVSRSLKDLLGSEYIETAARACSFLGGDPVSELTGDAEKMVDFFPAALSDRLSSMLGMVGERVLPAGLTESPAGAGSAKFDQATKRSAAPVSGLGQYRIGEDGRLYLITKSEHYHTPLGHSFPGYKLLDNARRLGIPNATHNNTRGYITRLLETELIRIANGISRDDRASLEGILGRQNDLRVVNRVINLETGSLAAEAALKMVLARFYRIQADLPEPKYAGKIPVIIVMGNDDGGLQANYHGTTVLTQIMRGMWPDIGTTLEKARFWKIIPVRPNRIEDIRRAFTEYNSGDYRIAGFFHEIVMMNYGGRRLEREFLHEAHALCEKYDVPTVVDEIQSCMWAPELFLFREYGLRPSMVAVGKGFPGGEYPASRILFSSALDVMPQFGALVTNGQEELASLAYLITMEWAVENAGVTSGLGRYYEDLLRGLAAEFPGVISAVDGWRHMTTLCFSDLQSAKRFSDTLNARGLDISAQTYKADCPPVVLTKVPLIADSRTLEFVVRAMREALAGQAE